MVEHHSTGGSCPAKTLSYDDFYTLNPATPCFVGEPERPPYGSPVTEAAKRLAKNVQLLRVSHGWSQETLAEIAGLDRTFVGAVERAERNITLATAEKLAKVSLASPDSNGHRAGRYHVETLTLWPLWRGLRKLVLARGRQRAPHRDEEDENTQVGLLICTEF